MRDEVFAFTGAALFAHLFHAKGAGLDDPLAFERSVSPSRIVLQPNRGWPSSRGAFFATKDLSSMLASCPGQNRREILRFALDDGQKQLSADNKARRTGLHLEASIARPKRLRPPGPHAEPQKKPTRATAAPNGKIRRSARRRPTSPTARSSSRLHSIPSEPTRRPFPFSPSPDAPN